MTAERRKAAIAAYKERKAAVGIFAAALRARRQGCGSARRATSKRCGTASRSRCAAAPTRAATCRRRGTRTATPASPSSGWNKLEDEALEFALQAALDERMAFWRQKLGAAAM